ncbi:MAG: hypothetical protein HDR43_01510 [Mycoplasma sp.]|nr:hypothetical protein [Mycoplasma sp.]
MSYVQKNMKFLKGKEKSLDFFETYLDISKLRILQILNDEQKELDNLKLIKYSNMKFLDEINSHFFKNEKTFVEEVDKDRKSREEIFFLVDAKENDDYSEVIYKKLEEILETKIKKGDSVITIGNRVNLIAQKLELNIIQHFPYDLYKKDDEFINKVASLVEVAFKNNVFSDATLIIAQQNTDNRELVMKKLAPFEHENIDESLFEESNVRKLEPSSNMNNEIGIEGNLSDINVDYVKYLRKLNIKKISFIPNISFFKFKLIKAIIKQNIVELKLVEKIQRLKLELQLLDEKKNKIHDELVVIQRLVNRVRREKETESSIVLYSAFKVRNQSTSILEDIKKKKDEDTILLKATRGGAR